MLLTHAASLPGLWLCQSYVLSALYTLNARTRLREQQIRIKTPSAMPTFSLGRFKPHQQSTALNIDWDEPVKPSKASAESELA